MAGCLFIPLGLGLKTAGLLAIVAIRLRNGVFLQYSGIFVSISLCLEIILIGGLYYQRLNGEYQLSKFYKAHMPKYFNNPFSQKIIDTVQFYLECCGHKTLSEWGTVGTILPSSCCNMTVKGGNFCPQHNGPKLSKLEVLYNHALKSGRTEGSFKHYIETSEQFDDALRGDMIMYIFVPCHDRIGKFVRLLTMVLTLFFLTLMGIQVIILILNWSLTRAITIGRPKDVLAY
ncbi:hypothetical protein SNEBB_003190 [Seison nebaliae]|nr:hypothetical protein SNEBB_003190 [Seison nebaliae]